MESPPKRIAPIKALIGFQEAKMTSATAIHPLPATTFSTQTDIITKDMYAPPSPQRAPPTQV